MTWQSADERAPRLGSSERRAFAAASRRRSNCAACAPSRRQYANAPRSCTGSKSPPTLSSISACPTKNKPPGESHRLTSCITRRARGGRQVDQQVPTEYRIKYFALKHRLGIDDIGPGESDRLANFGQHFHGSGR